MRVAISARAGDEVVRELEILGFRHFILAGEEKAPYCAYCADDMHARL